MSTELYVVAGAIIASCVFMRAWFGLTLKSAFAFAAVAALLCATAWVLNLDSLVNTLGTLAFLILLVSMALILLEGSAIAKYLLIFNKPTRPIFRK